MVQPLNALALLGLKPASLDSENVNMPMQSISRPKARSGHGMSLVKKADGGYVAALHGGRAQGDQLCRDTWLLEFDLP